MSHGTTTGKKQSPLYQSWSQMKGRCTNKNHPKYARYGGRGITVHPLWMESFAAFQADLLRDIGERPTKKHQLDRTDNDKGYFPGNIRWSLPVAQARNKGNNHKVFFRGAERTLQEVSELTGVDHRRLQHRVVDQKMSIDEAVNLPLEAGGEFYTYGGKIHKLAAWAEILKIPYYVLYDRLYKLKWPVEQAFGKPYTPKRRVRGEAK